MQTLSLADIAEQIALRASPTVARFNCSQAVCDWMKDTFCVYDCLPTTIGNHFFGTPIHAVDYLAYGFIEAEMSDGTRQIIDLRAKESPTKQEQQHD